MQAEAPDEQTLDGWRSFLSFNPGAFARCRIRSAGAHLCEPTAVWYRCKRYGDSGFSGARDAQNYRIHPATRPLQEGSRTLPHQLPARADWLHLRAGSVVADPALENRHEIPRLG